MKKKVVVETDVPKDEFRKKIIEWKEQKRLEYKDYRVQHDNLCNELLANIKKDLPKLKELLKDITGHWVYEDRIYRFYHQSFKVYFIQSYTEQMVTALVEAAPKGVKIDGDFLQILEEGTGKSFNKRSNSRWNKETRPMLEAFFHAKYFLEMAVKYGEDLKEVPQMLPSGFAGLLYFYGLR